MNLNNTIASACFIALSVGCTATNPYTGEKQISKATSGATVGAIAAAGGGIDHYMDTQEAKLREQLTGTGVSVSRNGDNITLSMPRNIMFGSGNAGLNPDFFKTLDSAGIVLTGDKETLITVADHTDNVGPDAANQPLKKKRGFTVAVYLGNRGVASQRLSGVGFGERSPIVPNTMAVGWDGIRRVEITLNLATAN